MFDGFVTVEATASMTAPAPYVNADVDISTTFSPLILRPDTIQIIC